MSREMLFAIGEALIDMIPDRTGCAFAEVGAFSPRLGGAPANVCGAFARLGGRSALLTQVGDDPFGHSIVAELSACGVDTSHICLTAEANTSLAFVTLDAAGERTFSFYRAPAPDLLYTPEQIDADCLSDAFALHFCSVALVPSPMRDAHWKAIRTARAAGALISFDPNLRFPLWLDREALKETVWEFAPQAHILKLSDEELPFLTGTDDIEAALPQLFTGDVQLVLYTCGAEGAWAFTKKTRAFQPAMQVAARDTTGAGDGMIGALLFRLQRDGVTPQTIGSRSREALEADLAFANRFCGLSVQKPGAIASYPTLEECLND